MTRTLITTGAFDGTHYAINATNDEQNPVEIVVTEGATVVSLYSMPGMFAVDATETARAMVRAGADAWTCDRIAFVFSLAERALTPVAA